MLKFIRVNIKYIVFRCSVSLPFNSQGPVGDPVETGKFLTFFGFAQTKFHGNATSKPALMPID